MMSTWISLLFELLIMNQALMPCEEVGRRRGDSIVAYFTTHKERTQDVEDEAYLHLAHNTTIMRDGFTLYV